MNPAWIARTGRLVLMPVSYGDKDDLQRIKSDPQVFAMMLGGVRSPREASEELAADMAHWAAHGYGMWVVRDRERGHFIGVVGLMDRPDGLGVALRFAVSPAWQGRGYAVEAASAALRFGHERAELRRIVAVARASNFDSRTVIGAIGMREVATFMRDGEPMVVYESVA